MDNKLLYELEDFISLGYQWIEKIEEEYQNTPREKTSEILSKFYRLVGEWQEQVKSGLPNESRKREFSMAKSNNPTYQANKSVDIQNLVKSIEAKIAVLKEYKSELRTPSFSVSSLGAHSRVNINSTDNSTNVIADQFVLTVNQLEAEFENNYIGPDKKELLSLISELKESKDSKGRTREILGRLLTRGAELAQIGSLIAQLLSV